MSQTPRDAVIHEYVKGLKMPAIGREYPALSRQARDGGWEYEEYLKELLEREMHSRYEHTAALRLKQARFPEVKTLDHLEWSALQGVSYQTAFRKLISTGSSPWMRTSNRHEKVSS
jgi:DNA replication protein DnaC